MKNTLAGSMLFKIYHYYYEYLRPFTLDSKCIFNTERHFVTLLEVFIASLNRICTYSLCSYTFSGAGKVNSKEFS